LDDKKYRRIENMKYKIGDKVRIKSLDWYNNNKDEDGIVELSTHVFVPGMSQFCGRVVTISHIGVDYYIMVEDLVGYWTDEMIEGLVAEETKPEPKFYIGDVVYSATWQRYVVITEILPDGFYEVGEYGTGRFKEHEDNLRETKFSTESKLIEIKSNANCLTRERVDELATKIDKELPSGNQNVWELSDGYQFVDENGNVINATKIVLEKKKEYPKTFEECMHVLEGENRMSLEQMNTFRKLIDARNAYWKIAGEEMGLGKPWKPSKDEMVYSFYRHSNKIETDIFSGESATFEFPTAKMRDAFKENFDPDIEICKEFL